MTGQKTITAALAAAKSRIGAVGKEQRNAQQGFQYRGIDDVVNAAAPHLNDEGVITVPELVEYSYETVEVGRNKTPMAHVVGKVRYWFYGPLGDFLTATVLSESMDSGDKGVAKMMSVAYRTALLQVLNLPTNDRDPDADSYERSPQNAPIAIQGPKAVSVNAAVVVKKAHEAEDVGTVREAYKEAGRTGVLQAETADPETGEKTTVQAYLERRGDELSLKSGPGGPETPSSRKVAGKK